MGDKKMDVIERSYPNQWGHAKKNIKVQFLPFVPAYTLPTLLLYLIIPFARTFFIIVFFTQVGLHITKLKWGVGFSDLPRFFKAQLNQNKLHGHRYHRRKSGTSFWSVACACFLASCLLANPVAHASYEIILPKNNAQQINPDVQSTLEPISMIDRHTIHQGFGHDTPLSMLLSQVIPRSFHVHWRDPELASLPVAWRSYDLDTIEILEDISERYGIRFRYSNRSGNVYVEWLDDNCIRGKDRASVYTIIC